MTPLPECLTCPFATKCAGPADAAADDAAWERIKASEEKAGPMMEPLSVDENGVASFAVLGALRGPAKLRNLARDVAELPGRARALRYDVTSWGGSGLVDQVARAVRQVGRKIPTFCLVHGEALSSGLTLAAAARRLFVSDRDARLGAIGIASFECWRGRPLWFTSRSPAKWRDPPSQAPIFCDREPTPEAVAEHQRSTEQAGEAFLREVARDRRVPLRLVRRLLGDGRVVQAVNILGSGLIDGVRTPAELARDVAIELGDIEINEIVD